ncbi:hypothetical protein [Saliphagus infecundisoli]|uniref:Uncharacterized protein n=1 Tax=Saliphagus infecundisoli TaxID=1849069 RepID=A0ABD5QCM1_9EURY|nr:hypothetical protein [Saliphagus infecundisoli]
MTHRLADCRSGGIPTREGAHLQSETVEPTDLDVADLDSIRPAVGVSALRTGTVLLGTQNAIEEFRDRFEDRSRIDDTHTDRMERFDTLLDRLEAEV